MEKEHKLKTLIVFFLTLSFVNLFFGCKENVTGPSEVFILSGTIENWSYGGNIMLKAEVYDTAYHQKLVIDSNIISSGGAFSIRLRDVPINFLYSINFSDSMYTANVTVNPPNTKSNKCFILTHPMGTFPVGVSLSLYNGNDSVPIGNIFRAGSINTSGWFYGIYLYFNQNVTISGTLIYYSGDTAHYNLLGKQGWNEVVIQTGSLSNFMYRGNISASEPPGGKWKANVYK